MLSYSLFGNTWLRFVLALAAGAVFPLALAPYGWLPVAIISPMLLYWLLQDASPARAFLLGEAYGVGLWFVGAFWLFTSIHTYGDTPAILAVGMVGFVAVAMGLFHAVFAYLLKRFLVCNPLSFAALWVLQEWLKTWLFTGFPWLFLGYAYTETSLDAYAPMLGVLGVSFIGIFLAAVVIELGKNPLWVVPAFVLFVGAFATQNIAWTKPTGDKPLTVTLVQGNIPQDMKWLTEYQNKTLEIYAGLSEPFFGKSDVVVWPESAIPMFQTQIWPFITNVATYGRQTQTTWVTGIPYQDVDAYDPKRDPYPPFYNSIIALGHEGSGLYKKQRLVPFGEYIPLQGALDWVLPNLSRSQEIMNFTEGARGQKPLMVRGHPLGSAVCYEVAYPDTTRRNAADTHFLITVSNDAWFGTSAGPLQHLQMVQMRARETGRWFIRATNTGVTAFIDERGHIKSQAKRFVKTTLTHELPAYTGTTPYMRWGNAPVLVWVWLLLAWAAWQRWQRG